MADPRIELALGHCSCSSLIEWRSARPRGAVKRQITRASKRLHLGSAPSRRQSRRTLITGPNGDLDKTDSVCVRGAVLNGSGLQAVLTMGTYLDAVGGISLLLDVERSN